MSAVPRDKAPDAPPSGDALRQAVLRRAMGGLERMVRETRPEVLWDALSTPTDLGTIARVVVEGATMDAVRQIDPYAAAVARGAEVRERLARDAGGLLSSTVVGQLLGITRQAVDKRRAAGRLLAMRRGDDWGYPAAQFRDGVVPDGLPEALAALAGEGPWVALGVLLAPDDALGGDSLMARLHAGDLASVRREIAARAAGAYG